MRKLLLLIVALIVNLQEQEKMDINMGFNDLYVIDCKKNFRVSMARGRISAEAINPVLKDKPEPKTVLCTNRHRSFEAFAKENKLVHQTVKVSAKQYKKEIYHAQHIKQHKKKDWMRNFNGVAIKYLQNYLNRQALKAIINENQSPVKKVITLIAASLSAWFEFKNIINLTYIN